ncbi:hypothetical protein QJS10_CPA07g00566 [Acorus calamus]|uniref:FAD-binding domain-containing protein n=1 Tax=Acorus calamus TaxID=4465 RepID=A0AAV9EI27_ACOCL|nr:hypothetical protein QJS10_CPA07g00566 [Acorus calamus]
MGEGGGGRAIVVGGSIAGLSCAHSLIAVGWKVLVLEKSCEPSIGSPTGAGLGLDPQARRFLDQWLSRLGLLHSITLPLTIDQNQATDSEKKTTQILTRDESFNFRAAHWADLHKLLYETLPPGVVLWGHQFVSLTTSSVNASVIVKAESLPKKEDLEFVGDLLVAADGCMSMIRKRFLPDFKLRYLGYYAWRGVLDFSENEDSDTITGLRKVYPELGSCLYFDLAHQTHIVLYELKHKRLNWIWYINGPEPELQGSSVTMKVNHEMVTKMHDEADKVWVPELARLMKQTESPFVNVIYDCDPPPRLAWGGNVVLVGDAAHPTSPHGLRSTNMSVLDAAVLGQCLQKCGPNGLASALEEYESLRLPVVAAQVAHSRRLGRVKQGLGVGGEEGLFDVNSLQQRWMPFFGSAACVGDHKC